MTKDTLPEPLPSDYLAIGFLEKVQAHDRAALATYGRVALFQKGDLLASQGSKQESLHVILEGTLKATRELPGIGAVVELGDVACGETVGEMSILDAHTASATVQALTDGRVWTIDRTQFEQFILGYPTAAPAVLRGLAVHITRRLRRTTRELTKLMDRE